MYFCIGNGGFSSIIDEITLTNALNSGYACAGGNSGHLDSDNNGGSGAPGVYLPFLHDKEQTETWIHNSIALFTSAAKEIVEKVYGCAPKYSYYQGCSTGGAQGFALAQFHPTLFDGIVAGSPGNWYSHLALSFLWNSVDTTVCYLLSKYTSRLHQKLIPCPFWGYLTELVLLTPGISGSDHPGCFGQMRHLGWRQRRRHREPANLRF